MMGDRALSSTLDVSVCLLLITASAVTLANAPPTTDRESTPDADATLEVVATTTAWIDYSMPDGSRRKGEGVAELTRSNWSAHGTLAGLLAATAISNASIHGQSVRAGSSFQEAVDERTRQTIRRLGGRMQLLVHWQPYPGSHVRGATAVGRSPPRSADVYAAHIFVPVESGVSHQRAVDAARRGGFERVAAIVTTATNRLLSTPLSRGYSPQGNHVTRIETEDVEADLRAGFDSPVEAARAVRVGRVRLTIRMWSP
jgi:hypothetical protein